jgi:hypothetical protein
LRYSLTRVWVLPAPAEDRYIFSVASVLASNQRCDYLKQSIADFEKQ